MLLHLSIFFPITAKGVTHVFPAQGILGSELTEKVDFVFRLRIIVEQRRKVATPESKDMRGALHEFDRHGLTAVLREIKSAFLGQCDTMLAGRLARKCTDSSTLNLVVRAAFDQVTKKRLSQGAAAGVSSADKKDAFQRARRVPR